MLKKSQSPRSIDGFIPQSNTPRRVGFDSVNRSRPDQKKPQAGTFPGIGQTLSAYSPSSGMLPPPQSASAARPVSSPFDLDIDEPAKPGKTKVAKKGFFKRIRAWRWKRIMATLLVFFLLIGGWLGYKFIYNASKTFRGNIFGILSTTKLKGEDVGRVNVLLAGNSSDDPGHDGANLTDSIMVLSMDTKNHTAFMMSIPRDLWVEIPGYGHAKINEAYVDGQSGHYNESGYFPGGMGLLQQVVQDNFNINLNYYALIDYGALRDMVNAVGGIDITIKSSDPRGLYDPSKDWTTHGPLVKLSNGPHTINGQQALDLARARGDAYGSYGFPGSDFDRTAHQRQMLVALKSKIVSAGVVSNPLTVSKLTDSVGKNIKTNMTLSEARRAYDLGKDISNIQSLGLNNVNGKNLLASYTSPYGQSALIPAAGVDDFSDIQALLKQVTSNDPLVRESASVVVLNGTSTSGLAASASKRLSDKNIDVAATGDATTPATKTLVIDASGGSKPATLSTLKSMFGVAQSTTTNPYKNIYDADFIVVLGDDQIPKASSSSTNP